MRTPETERVKKSLGQIITDKVQTVLETTKAEQKTQKLCALANQILNQKNIPEEIIQKTCEYIRNSTKNNSTFTPQESQTGLQAKRDIVKTVASHIINALKDEQLQQKAQNLDEHIKTQIALLQQALSNLFLTINTTINLETEKQLIYQIISSQQPSANLKKEILAALAENSEYGLITTEKTLQIIATMITESNETERIPAPKPLEEYYVY